MNAQTDFYDILKSYEAAGFADFVVDDPVESVVDALHNTYWKFQSHFEREPTAIYISTAAENDLSKEMNVQVNPPYRFSGIPVEIVPMDDFLMVVAVGFSEESLSRLSSAPSWYRILRERKAEDEIRGDELNVSRLTRELLHVRSSARDPYGSRPRTYDQQVWERRLAGRHR